MVKKGLLEPNFLGIVAFPTGFPSFDEWWEWVLVAIIGISVVAGTVACVWFSFRSIRKLLSV